QTAKEATKQYGAAAQFDKALKWLENERRKKSQHSFYRKQEQLRIKLIQKGFDYAVVSEVFAESEPTIDIEREKELFQKQAEKLLRKHQRKLAGFDLKMKVKAALYQRGFQSDMIDAFVDHIEEHH